MERPTKLLAETSVITGKKYAMHDFPLADELGGVARRAGFKGLGSSSDS
jgi:hypothetical protein